MLASKRKMETLTAKPADWAHTPPSRPMMQDLFTITIPVAMRWSSAWSSTNACQDISPLFFFVGFFAKFHPVSFARLGGSMTISNKHLTFKQGIQTLPVIACDVYV